MNEKKYVVLHTEFHGGNEISRHISLNEAIKSVKKNTLSDCTCGCAYVRPLNKEAQNQLLSHELYSGVEKEDLPIYEL